MRFLVTGAFGFVGLNVTRELARQGHAAIAVGRSEPDEWIKQFLAGIRDRVTFVKADISRPGELAGAVGGASVEAIIHAAVITATTIEVERDAGREIVAVNVGGTVEALELARASGARRFVYVSSPAAIGPSGGDGLIDESVAPHPATLYGITKLTSELLTRRYAEMHGLSTVSVRIAQPYGAGERATASRVRTSPIYEWLEAARRGETLVTGPLDMARDWTWIEETARGIAALVIAETLRHDLYHLSVGRLFSVGEVIDELRLEFPHLVVDDQPDAPGLNPNIAAPARRALDSRRFRDELGWAPQATIQEGMQRYLEWRRSWRL